MDQRTILEKAVADADAKHRTAVDALQTRIDAMTATKASISDLQRRFDAACLAVADGNAKAEDPSTLQGQIQRLEHRLRGETQLHAAALNAQAERNRTLVEAQTALQALNEQEELERLQAAVKTETANVAAAEGTLREANQRLAAAKRAHSQFARKLDPSLRSCLNA